MPSLARYVTTPDSFSSFFFFYSHDHHRDLHSFPTRRSSDLSRLQVCRCPGGSTGLRGRNPWPAERSACRRELRRSEEHTSELQSPDHLVCRLLLEKKKK